MKLLMDARFTRLEQHDGISRYGASLMEATAKYVEVTMLIHDRRQLHLLPGLPWLQVNSVESLKELFLARTINSLGFDVVFSPMQVIGSFGRRYGLIVTLHDLIYYYARTPPRFLPAPVRLLWRLYHLSYWPQRLLLNRGDVVATVSHTTADLIAEHRLTRRPVRVISNAPQPGAHRHTGHPENLLVYMGSFMPYKNVDTLVAAMAHLPGYTLHLMSSVSPLRRRELLERAGEGKLVFHNGASEQTYREVLARARALVQISTCEGFGLPIVEAMSTGTPVIASDIPIFHEVGETAAVFVDPGSPQALAAAVRRLEEPAYWEERSAASQHAASRYTWDASARALVAAAQEALTLRRNRGHSKGSAPGSLPFI